MGRPLASVSSQQELACRSKLRKAWLRSFLVALLGAVACRRDAIADVDLVASAALAAASQAGDVGVLEALLEPRFERARCSLGPVEASCQEEARARLEIIRCQDEAPSEQVSTSHQQLARRIADATIEKKGDSVLRWAACDFTIGPCGSDVVRVRVPHEIITPERMGFGRSTGLELVEAGDYSAVYRLSGIDERETRLRFERRPTAMGWNWAGICGEEPSPE